MTNPNVLDKEKLVLFDARLMNLFIDVKRVGLGCPSDYGFSNVCYKKQLTKRVCIVLIALMMKNAQYASPVQSAPLPS